MSENLYELIALGARYFFVALMLLIVIRAWRITIIDSRRAAKLRRWAPETGVIGEFQVLDGDERARKGMIYPVIREGLIGRSRKADIRLRSRSVHVRHAYFEMAEDGLRLRAAGAARVDAGQGRTRHLALKDGDTLRVGRVRLLLVLNEAGTAVMQPPPIDDELEHPFDHVPTAQAAKADRPAQAAPEAEAAKTPPAEAAVGAEAQAEEEKDMDGFDRLEAEAQAAGEEADDGMDDFDRLEAEAQAAGEEADDGMDDFDRLEAEAQAAGEETGDGMDDFDRLEAEAQAAGEEADDGMDDFDRLEAEAQAKERDAAADAAIYGKARKKPAPKRDDEEEWWPRG